MTRIYRVETVHGTGMYRTFHRGELKTCDDMQGDRHPAPYDDAKLEYPYATIFDEKKHQFAFASMEQLKGWIYKARWREELHNAGLHISIIEASDVSFGDTQVFYDKSKCATIAQISLLGLD